MLGVFTGLELDMVEIPLKPESENAVGHIIGGKFDSAKHQHRVFRCMMSSPQNGMVPSELEKRRVEVFSLVQGRYIYSRKYICQVKLLMITSVCA